MTPWPPPLYTAPLCVFYLPLYLKKMFTEAAGASPLFMHTPRGAPQIEVAGMDVTVQPFDLRRLLLDCQHVLQPEGGWWAGERRCRGAGLRGTEGARALEHCL